jgi:uncharacterized Zn finger protein
MSWYRRRSSYRDYGYGSFAPYVPVATRLANGSKQAKALAKKEGRDLEPVKITGRNMATTYWGKAWCENLEAYSDYSNRLPRGRTYARNGSVVDLQIKNGKIEALVSGSSLYKIAITIETLTKPMWTHIKAECSQSIASLIDLLQGRFDEGVMKRLAHPTEGLFPRPKEIKMRCSCPDSAGLCKHLAAVLYGVGNRLDNSPELLFTLRNVDHLELVSQAMAEGNLHSTLDAGNDNSLAGSDLGEMFGIDLDQKEAAPKKALRAKKLVAAKPLATGAAVRKASSKTTATTKTAATKKRSATVKGKRGKAMAVSSITRRKPR